MLKKIKKFWPIGIIILIVCSFFWKVFLQDKVLLPADLVVGAYYPWLNYDWGTTTGVAVKNPLMTDSVSQFFLWKKIIVDSFKNGELPLWNPFSYSGYPLMANLHSGAFYILNVFLFLPSFVTGWNLFCISGVLLSTLAVYFLAKEMGGSKGASLIGAIAYGLSGFSQSWMEFATAGHSMIYLPLIILCIEKFAKSKNSKNLYPISILVLLLVSVGHFQITVYTLVLAFSYFCCRVLQFKKIFSFSGWILLGLIMSSIILIPGFETYFASVRNLEVYISKVNYGLLPLENLITILAPDYFGNPATYNYWGFMNYHESIVYAGALVIFVLIWAIGERKRLGSKHKFFLGSGLISLLFLFDNFVSRFMFKLGIPGISTGAAGRIAIVFNFSTAILTVKFVDEIKKAKIKKIKKYFYKVPIIVLSFLILNYGTKYYRPTFISNWASIENINIGFRNLILPFILVMANLLVIVFFRKKKVFYLMLGTILFFDLYRFGTKYLPIAPRNYVFPDTESIDFIKKDKSIFRVEKEKEGAVLPPNMWTYFGLMSPSGYDPMALADYSDYYNKTINGTRGGYSRYNEAERYDAETLGKFNVKYFLTLRRNEDGKYDEDGGLLKKINADDWAIVFEKGPLVVLKNKKYKQRVFFVDNDDAKAEISDYKNNKVITNYETDNDSKLVLLDTWYPGWVATINGDEVAIDKYDQIFRSIDVKKGRGEIVFEYKPRSFRIGMYLSAVAFLAWLLLWFRVRKR